MGWGWTIWPFHKSFPRTNSVLLIFCLGDILRLQTCSSKTRISMNFSIEPLFRQQSQSSHMMIERPPGTRIRTSFPNTGYAIKSARHMLQRNEMPLRWLAYGTKQYNERSQARWLTGAAEPRESLESKPLRGWHLVRPNYKESCRLVKLWKRKFCESDEVSRAFSAFSSVRNECVWRLCQTWRSFWHRLFKR